MSPAGAIEASAFAQAMRDSSWLYPSVLFVHVLGIALLFGSIAMLDVRLIGIWKKASVKALAAQVLPWSAGSFLLILPSGLAMFAANAGELIASPVFLAKMCLIMAAGINAAAFHAITLPSVNVWDSPQMRALGPPPSARVAGAFSLVLWASVIACGLTLANF
jgi:hypothetical protein